MPETDDTHMLLKWVKPMSYKTKDEYSAYTKNNIMVIDYLGNPIT